MFPIFFGLVAAMLFGLIVMITLGEQALMTHAWVDVVFWTLIASGAALSAINLSWDCIACKMSKLSHANKLTERLCRDTRCAGGL